MGVLFMVFLIGSFGVVFAEQYEKEGFVTSRGVYVQENRCLHDSRSR